MVDRFTGSETVDRMLDITTNWIKKCNGNGWYISNFMSQSLCSSCQSLLPFLLYQTSVIETRIVTNVNNNHIERKQYNLFRSIGWFSPGFHEERQKC